MVRILIAQISTTHIFILNLLVFILRTAIKGIFLIMCGAIMCK